VVFRERFFGLIFVGFRVGAPLTAPFPGYAGTPRPPSQGEAQEVSGKGRHPDGDARGSMPMVRMNRPVLSLG